MFDLYTLLCCLSFILLIVWFLFTEHEEEPVSTTPPRPKEKPKPVSNELVAEVVDECVGAVEDAVALQEELDTEKEKLLQTIRRRLKPSGASSGQGLTPV